MERRRGEDVEKWIGCGEKKGRGCGEVFRMWREEVDRMWNDASSVISILT